MDAKEILRLLVQNRFWIAVGIAFILPIIGYFVTAGSVKSETEAKAAEIKGAEDGAKSYASGTVPNGQYAEYTQAKIALIEDDVDEAHGRLYDRQAPLLDWPEEVAPQLSAWGRDIPEDVSENETQAVSYVYTQVYDDYAKEVFKAVNPWDPVTGEGIVVTPPMEALLQMVSFTDDITQLPSISKIWQYQENLWVRRSILEVIAEVNKKAGATDWESAPIKNLLTMEVGNAVAVDHKTSAEGYELQDPPEVKKGGQSIEPETSAGAGAGGMAGGRPGEMMDMGMEGMMGGQMGSMMSGMGMGMGMGMGATKSGEPVRFLQEEGVELFRDYPAVVSVLIDQNSIQNFLVEFENSPMSMRVLEANWTRPKTRVQPPVKGQGFAGYAGMGGFGMGAGGGVLGMMGMGEMMDMGMGGMMGGQMGGMMGGRGGMGMMGMEGMMDMGMMGGQMGGRGMSLNQPRQKVRRDLSKGQDKDEKGDLDPEKVTIYDPYYNIVELQVYVQARFYYPPAPEDPTSEASLGDPTVGDQEPGLDGEGPVTDELGTEPAPPADEAAAEAPAAPADVPVEEQPGEPGVTPGDAEASAEPAPDATEPPSEPAPPAEPEAPEVDVEVEAEPGAAGPSR
jgi:hypothetical protein